MLASLRRPASRPARSSSRWLSSTVSRHNNTTWNTPPSPYAHSDSTPIARRTEPPGAKPSSISLTAAQANALKIVEFPVEADPLLHFMSSLIMKDGKRKTADRSISRMLLHIHAMTRNPPLEILRVAIQKASPFVRTVPIRRAAKMVHYPAALSEKQRVHRGINSILEACDKRPGQTIAERLAREVIAIAIAETPEENEVLMKKKREHEFVMVNRGNIRVRT